MAADMKQSGDIYASIANAASIFTNKSSSLDCSTLKSIKLELTTAM
jgi:hypothetical protein